MSETAKETELAQRFEQCGKILADTLQLAVDIAKALPDRRNGM